MELIITFQLECGHKVTEYKDYWWNTDNIIENDKEQARYESFISFNKPGFKLHCKEHNDYRRIRDIHIRVKEWDIKRDFV